MSATSTACGSRSIKSASGLLLSALLFGCASPRAPEKPRISVAPAPEPFVAPPEANIELVVAEAVAGPEDDTASFTKIFIDGKEAGKTPVGPRSQERRWAGRVDPGNHLFRFEQWYLPHAGEWGVLDAQWQPTERFIRVEVGSRATVALKFSDGAKRFELAVARRPLP